MQRLQEQLDLQWDYLENRDVRIHEVRKAISEILSDIATEKGELAIEIENNLRETRKEVERQKKAAERKKVLDNQLDELMHTEEAIKLSETKKLLADIDRQIEELKKKKASARQVVSELESIVGARKARITSQLDALPPSNPRILTVEKQLLNELDENNREFEASTEGVQVWESVIDYLNILDTQMQGPPVQIVSALEEAVVWLTEKGSLVTSKHWGPLIVAIGHELEIIKEALNGFKIVEH